MARFARRSIADRLIGQIVLCVLLASTSWAQFAGSVNIRALGGTPIPAGVVDTGNDAIKVNCVVGCGAGGGSSGGISLVDGAAFTENTTEFNPIGGVFNDGLTDVTSGDAAAVRITPDRGLHVNLRNVTGTEVGTAAAPLRTDPTGTTTQPVSGTVSISGTVTVSGTVTANQGGSPWGVRLQDGAGAPLATVTAGNALKVDGSGVTQPVSGTITVTDGSGALNVIVDSSGLPSGASTSAKQDTVIGHVDGIEGLLTTIDADTGGILTSVQTLDNAISGNEMQVDVVAALPAGNNNIGDVDVASIAAGNNNIGDVDVATLPNEGQQTMANSISVALSSDQTVPDPCMFRLKASVPIDIVTATTTQLVAASASNKLYVCSLHLVTNAANNVALVEDDTSACASPTAGVTGGVTAGEGYNFGANGGLTLGNGGGTVAITAATNRYVCLITSAATQLSGSMTYVLAP